MPIATVELVLFAVKAGIKLGQAARQGYIEQTKLRQIALPIPNAGFTLEVIHAREFFNVEGADCLAEDSRLTELHALAIARAIGDTGEATHDQYMDRYLYYRSVYLAKKSNDDVAVVSGPGINPDALLALFRFEQWEDEDPNRPKPLRRVLGAIVDVGIEYFATVPGAITADTRHRKVFKSFVQALDELDFQEIALDEFPLAELMSGLLVAALETIGEQPELVSSDKYVQDLVRVATASLGRDIAQRLEESVNTDESDSVGAWGELVFRSVLRSAGKQVLERPAVFLGVKDDVQGAVVSRVGIAAIDLVSDRSGLDPERLFSREGLDTLLSATLSAVADHPELIVDTDNEGVEALIGAIARDLSEMERVVDLALVPEVARLVFERSGQHLDLIWPGLRPESHLLLTASRITLELLTAEPPEDASWRPALGRNDLLTVLDAVIDELSGNPTWLLVLAQDTDANLRVVLGATLGVLRRRADERLSPSVGAEVIALSMKAVAKRQRFLKGLPDGEPVIAAAIDAVIGALFEAPANSEASWMLLRDESITGIVGLALDALAGSVLDDKAIDTTRDTLSAAVRRLMDGEAVALDDIQTDLIGALIPNTEDDA